MLAPLLLTHTRVHGPNRGKDGQQVFEAFRQLHIVTASSRQANREQMRQVLVDPSHATLLGIRTGATENDGLIPAAPSSLVASMSSDTRLAIEADDEAGVFLIVTLICALILYLPLRRPSATADDGMRRGMHRSHYLLTRTQKTRRVMLGGAVAGSVFHLFFAVVHSLSPNTDFGASLPTYGILVSAGCGLISIVSAYTVSYFAVTLVLAWYITGNEIGLIFQSGISLMVAFVVLGLLWWKGAEIAAWFVNMVLYALSASFCVSQNSYSLHRKYLTTTDRAPLNLVIPLGIVYAGIHYVAAPYLYALTGISYYEEVQPQRDEYGRDLTRVERNTREEIEMT